MNILSFHVGHDSSACILKNGEVVLYFKEERLSRTKRDKFPYLSIKKLFENFNETIDYFCISAISSKTIGHFVNFLIKQYNIKEDKLIIFSREHHSCHSFYSFCNSKFDECIGIVADGSGSILDSVSECETIFHHSHNEKFLEIQKNVFKSVHNVVGYNKKDTALVCEEIKNNYKCECNYNGSVGGITSLYNTGAFLISQPELENGKVMGLSSYGKEISDFPKLFENNNGKVDEKLFITDRENPSIILFKSFENMVTKNVTKENYQFYANYAYELQKQTQKAVGNLIEKSIEKTGIKKVCISGGYGMNIVANYYYLQRFPDVEFYFEPLSDDSCISIGAAKLFFHTENKDAKINPIETTSFHGLNHDLSSFKGTKTSIKDIAHLLYQNKSVAVYSGLSEAGQRALGNRSILFNALNVNAKDIVNKIKKREWYRPFACIVLEEDANIYFDMGRIKSSPHMTICFPVREEYAKIIPGVTHVDNTCRIQTVSDGHLYELLQEFKKLSGHGILLNTSFNLSGEPLVETPTDAINTLNNSFLDHLWFEETQQLF